MKWKGTGADISGKVQVGHIITSSFIQATNTYDFLGYFDLIRVIELQSDVRIIDIFVYGVKSVNDTNYRIQEKVWVSAYNNKFVGI